ncbi:endo-1,4-beta-xylanase [Aurantiacibacter poecillastricola]|uniref:endo-1,4-beta-xylanase n=1 Tax=Aurantiacibacter poecillastricola TaxID=3064385 RepID=UPI00273FEDA7|nr:endo-1,4-beta-xylanase [Aurantiacibacter sp. 219JJ12-13]MDP5260257.1 endo-1,4-beta-xylanase [Aurantiacibacter sp. 219JJ12-13]
MEKFTISRRAALLGLAAMPLAGCGSDSGSGISPVLSSPPPSALPPGPAPGPSLNAIAQTRGRYFGSAIASIPGTDQAGSIQNPRYTEIVKAECGMVVPENEMKWQTTRPGPETYDFTQMDAIVAWAQANDMAVRGHTLLWHRPQWFPEWLNNYDFGANPAAEAERLLTEHIRTVTDRYRGVITSYDVVNEAIDHDRNAPIETSLSRAMGSPEAVLDLAFHTAREQLPQGQLVYNDYMSWEPVHLEHCADVLRLLEGFRSRDVPVDALGIQSHIEMFDIDPATGVGPYAEREWRNFLDEVVGMGYRLLITEFDVKDKALPSDIALRDERVADYTRRYFDLMLDYDEHLDDVLAWGMVDQFNWLQYFDPAKRDDGLEVRGTPYESDYSPKLMRTALAETLGA